MNEPFKAIFESGVLKPLAPLPLGEHEVVILTIARREMAASPNCGLPDELLDHDLLDIAEREAEGEIPLEELRDRLSSIRGSMSDVVISERGEY
jgi:predicted DNA-binding antitoxin AbrB/MazE fold protein